MTSKCRKVLSSILPPHANLMQFDLSRYCLSHSKGSVKGKPISLLGGEIGRSAMTNLPCMLRSHLK